MADRRDQRLAEVASHWRPRFFGNGVDPSDYDRIIASLDSWDGWLEAWTKAASVHEALGREALSGGFSLSAGRHLSRAAVYYHFAKFFWVKDREAMRRAHLMAVRCLDDALPHLRPPGRRVEIPFENGTIVGILRTPLGSGPDGSAGADAGPDAPLSGRPPGVVLLPGLDSAKEELRPSEDLFLERGLATFTVDGPGQGEAEYDLPIRPDWEVPGAAILDALQAEQAVDPLRIGIWGVSLGGYYAARIASTDPRVSACVSLSPPFSFGTTWDELPVLTREAFRVRSFSSSEGEAREKALELTLEERAEMITAPLLVVVGGADRVVPPSQSEMLASRAGGPVELLYFEQGNHNCTNMSYAHRPQAADWMAARLSKSTRRGGTGET